MSDKVYIYGLEDPRNQQVRYVGKTNNLNKRLVMHCNHLSPRNRKVNWIKNLLSEGFKPNIFVLEKVDFDKWEECERFWIAYLKFVGCNLVNASLGGGGCSIVKHSPETLEKMRLIKIGKKQSQETKEKIRKNHLGVKFSEEHRKNLSVALKKRGGTWNGKHHTEATKEKLRLFRLGKKNNLTEEQKLRRSIRFTFLNKSRIGQKCSEEHRRKVSEAGKISWAKRKGVIS